MAGGRATAYIALALLAAGVLFALPSLYVPAIALGLLALGAIAWVEAAAREAGVKLIAGPRTIVEGTPYRIGLRVHWGRAPSPGGYLSHPALGRPLAIGSGASSDVVAELRFPRWGPQEVEGPVLSIRDPLRLHERRLEGDPGGRVLVLPRVEPLLAPGDGDGGEPGLRPGLAGLGAGGRTARSFEPEIDGLRPWRQGSPASRIHWPSLARTGELLERSLTGGGDSSPLVVLDRSQGAEGDSLLKAVRATASLCLHLARAGGCSLLLPGEGRVLAVDRELRSWPRVHARLALVDPEHRAPAYPPPGATTIFWVSPSGRLDARASGRDGGDGYLVTPAAVSHARAAFQVAGCRGYPLAAATRGAETASERPVPAGRGTR